MGDMSSRRFKEFFYSDEKILVTINEKKKLNI